MSLEPIACGQECYSVSLQLTPDNANLASITIQRPCLQLAIQMSLTGIEQCLPYANCPLIKQVELINKSLTSYQRRLAVECFPCTGNNGLFNSFLMGLTYVVVCHALILSCYKPMSKVKLSCLLSQSINRTNACLLLGNVGIDLDPCDMRLIYGYRNFWRVWAGCFPRGDDNQVLDELVTWMNRSVDSSEDCSQVFSDLPQDDVFEVLAANPVQVEVQPIDQQLNQLMSDFDQYQTLVGNLCDEEQLVNLERQVRDLAASVSDLDDRVNQLAGTCQDCELRLERLGQPGQAGLDERVANLERQMATYTKLLRDLSLKICQ